jgi:hypothetical protein
LLAWWQASVENIRRGKWWLVYVPIILWFVGGVAEHRFFEFINRFLDAHAADFVARVRPVLIFKGPLGLAAIGLAIVFLVLIIRAYFTSKPAIVGAADLMLQELDISDLENANDLSSYKVNAAVFARIEVAVLDRPRTIKHFEIEMIAPDETRYSAKSEYEVGQYDHKHDVSEKDAWGFATVESVREPMEDLASKVRTPIPPLTHVARAWVRFEIKGVKQRHKPSNCKIQIFAVDPSGRRHEIRTDDMNVKAIDDSKEYAVIRGKSGL